MNRINETKVASIYDLGEFLENSPFSSWVCVISMDEG